MSFFFMPSKQQETRLYYEKENRNLWWNHASPYYPRITYVCNKSREFLVNYGGSEANVAISIANFGGDVEYITRLPDNALGETCLAELRSHNIGTRHILIGGHRLGTYYMEKAAAMRNSKVIYDREGSAFSELKPGMIDWHAAFADAAIFHWSGIDAALTPGLAEVCKEAITVAKEMGLTISYDINYRKEPLELW